MAWLPWKDSLSLHRTGYFWLLWAAICLSSPLVSAVDDYEALVDPNTGLPMASRPTAYGKWLNSKYLNVASSHNGGTVRAGYSQPGFEVASSIDGVTTGELGWAYHGQIHKAIAMYSFKEDYRISSLRLLSGVGRPSDHHVTSFQVWYSNSSKAHLPPAIHWFPHYYWHPVLDMRPMTLDSVVVGNRVFTNGDEEIVMRFSPVRAKHVLIKIDAADSPANNAVVTEFEVFTADPSEVSAPQNEIVQEFVDMSWMSPPPKSIAWRAQDTSTPLLEGPPRGGAVDGALVPLPESDVVPFRAWKDRMSLAGNKTRSQLPDTFAQASKALGWDAALNMRKLNSGRWFTPLSAKSDYMQPHRKSGLITQGMRVGTPPNETCEHLSGTDFLFLGDTRTRHTFLSTVAYFRGASLRGFVNPGHAAFYGTQDGNYWHPPGRGESCGATMPYGFELECAGVVGGEVSVCNGTVTLRLEEHDDRERLLKRLGHWMSVRESCAASEACGGRNLIVLMSPVIPKIRSFSSMSPVHPTVTLMDMNDYLSKVIGLMQPSWNASSERASWAGGKVNALRTTLVWATMEPLFLMEPRHAPHNRNISQINSESRLMLDVAGIPILDAFGLALDRVDCVPDKIHYNWAVQNLKVGVLLTFARDLARKLSVEERHWRTEPELEAAAAAAEHRKGGGVNVVVDAEEEARLAEEAANELRRKSAADEARARRIQEELEAKKARQAKVKDKFAKFDKARAKGGGGKAKPRGEGGGASKEHGGGGSCGTTAPAAGEEGTCSGPPQPEDLSSKEASPAEEGAEEETEILL